MFFMIYLWICFWDTISKFMIFVALLVDQFGNLRVTNTIALITMVMLKL